MKVADFLAQDLKRRGISHVFELVGGMITFLLDSIQQQTDIRIVSVHHEQGAAFAAEGWARMAGVPGVAFATSGPGATNLLTGIGSCYFDSIPAVFITGQVNRHEQKGDRAIRQLGFQETDIVAMAKPITKAAWQVKDAAAFPDLLQRAFALAAEGRPGPVLLDIPMDVQRAEITATDIRTTSKIATAPTAVDPAGRQQFLDRLNLALLRAERPMILAGGGIRAAQAQTAFLQFAERTGLPVVSSLLAVDIIPFGHPLHVGMIGSYGNRWANLSLGAADLLIVLGSRLDVRQTGAMTEAFKAGKEIFHVDAEAGEINNRITGCVPWVEHLGAFLDAANEDRREPQGRTAWHQQIAQLRLQFPDTAELKGLKGINPNQFMHELAQQSARASAFVVDVGQHQMWAAQSLEIGRAQRFLTSGGMGAMGFALPAAIGAAFAAAKPVVLIAGDGGFQCNIQELQTIVRNRLPIKLVVVNNRTHGMVRQFQQSYFHERYQSTLVGYDAPDFARVAEAYGITARTVSDPSDVAEHLQWLWADPLAPQLLQVMIDTFANVYPKIAFGQPNTSMEPDFKPLAMEGT